MRNAPALAARGFEPIPIVPRQKYPAVKGWDHVPIQADAWAAQFPDHGIGLRLGHELDGGYLIAVDFDIYDPAAATAALRAADLILGPSPTRTGLAPKALRLYTLEVDEAPVKRMTPVWEDFLGLRHRVEVLAKGQQAVVDGVHPSGAPYTWTEPLAAPPISPEQLGRFLAEMEEIAREADWAEVEAAAEAAAGTDDWVPPVNVTHDELRAALAMLDPDCSYAQWLNVGLALHHQYEGGHEGFELWDDWSSRGDKYPGERELRQKWAGFHPVNPRGRTVTVRTILGQARALREVRARDNPPNALPAAEVEGQLARNERGGIVGSMKNCAIIIGHDEGLPITWFDEMTRRIHYGDRILTDADVLAIKRHIAQTYHVEPTTQNVREAVELVAADHASHPVQDYLNGLVWDGVPRLDTWLTKYFGAISDPHVSEVGRKTLVAAVARALKPGTKWDYMLVIEGPQRRGKSSAIHALVPRATWSVDLEVSRDERRMQEIISSAWIVECGELRGMGQADIRTLKAFLSRTRDTYRGAYERYVADRPRQCVLIGTTNDSSYLTDDTGNRRFIPVKVTGANVPGIIADRDQLWAEARVAYLGGEELDWTQAVLPTLAAEQEQRLVRDDWENAISAYLADNPTDFIRGETIALEALGVTKDRLDLGIQKRIGSALRRIGWEAGTKRVDGAAVWGWRKKSVGNL